MDLQLYSQEGNDYRADDLSSLSDFGQNFFEVQSPFRDQITAERHTYDIDPRETFSDVPFMGVSAKEDIPKSPEAVEETQKLYNYLKASILEPTVEEQSLRPQQQLPITRIKTNQTNNSSSTHVYPLVTLTSNNKHQLQLLHPVEDTFRPRYKSDYFTQGGISRHPRYIADNLGNHYLSVIIPEIYRFDMYNNFLRIAWITVNIDGMGHRYSPSKFQRNNVDINMPDENPIYQPIQPTIDTDGVMKLQLVLIKPKLDQLSNEQPLPIFSDDPAQSRNMISEKRLSPKELISKYQLNRAHIAFTICTRLPDGSYQPHPKSTFISSVITELSTAKKSAEAAVVQQVQCPCCSSEFYVQELTEEDHVSSCKTAINTKMNNKTDNSTQKKKKNI